MAHFKPAVPFSVPLVLLVPTYAEESGVPVKTFPTLEQGALFYGSFKSYGGTETNINGLYSVEDTAIIECWFRPDIKSDCRVALPESGAVYEVWGEPENIEKRNQFLKFKVRRYKGGA